MTERDTAQFVNVKDLLSSQYTENQNTPSTLSIGNNQISRLRLFGTIVSENPYIIDDGTGCITLRNFDQTFDAQIGDFVHCIGRPRSHQNEPYILIEIIKKTTTTWKKYFEKSSTTKLDKKTDPLNIIRTLDTGNGASFEEIAKQIGQNAEDIITNLLARGDIFEIAPGKLKILE